MLLTGVNQIDHLKQFDSLASQILNNFPSRITILQSRDCPNVKAAIEALVGGLINQKSDDEDEAPRKFKRNQLTFPVLEAEYLDNYKDSENKPLLVVMIADFEQFNAACIQELIAMMTSYTHRLPFVLVLGMATAFKALHNILPTHVTNRMDANVFQSESSTTMLNKILEEIVLTHHSPVHLSGRSFKILMDVFLFYDYSLNSFIKGYKVFMLEHFSSLPLSGRLSGKERDGFENLNHDECEVIRQSCPSFRKFVESEEDPQARIDLITSDEYLKNKLRKQVLKVEQFWFHFYCSLRILAVLFEDLPRNELGKLVRELYPICVSTDVTKLPEFQECFQLLRFTSKEKFVAKMDKILAIVMSFVEDNAVEQKKKKDLQKVKLNLETFRKLIADAGMSPRKEPTAPKTPSTPSGVTKTNTTRQEMMEKLKESAQNNPTRVIVEYENQLWRCLDYMKEIMEKYLQPIPEAPAFYEFSAFTDHQSAKRQIVGAPRGALHNALSNPQHYLHCSCCDMPENERILPTLPDVSIGYKLHLECNQFINLYDWLQAFAMVIEVNEDEDDISPEIQ